MNTPLHTLASVITEKFIAAAPNKAAKALSSLATHEALLLISPLKAQLIVNCLNEMDADKAAAILRRIPLKQASFVLSHLELAKASAIMKLFSGPYRERISSVLDSSFVSLLSQNAEFSPSTVGYYMQTSCISMKTDTKISLLVERLKSLPRTKIPSVCWIVDKSNLLKGYIRTVELSFYGKDTLLGSVMQSCMGVMPTQDVQIARELFLKQDLDVLPVVSEKNSLLGQIAKQDLPVESDKKSIWNRIISK